MLENFFLFIFWYLIGSLISITYITILNRLKCFYEIDGILPIKDALEISMFSWIAVFGLIFATIATILVVVICKTSKWLSAFKRMQKLKQIIINIIENRKD